MKKHLILIITVITFSSCFNNDCPDYSPGPPSMYVELVHADSGINIFSDGSYQESDIKVEKENDVNHEFSFIKERDLNIISFHPYTYTEENTIYVKIGDGINIEITFDILEHKSDCFTNFYIKNENVANYSFEVDVDKGLLVIKI